MWPIVVSRLMCLAPIAADLPEAPPPRPAPIRVGAIEGGSLTITPNGPVKVEPVQTPAGPRVRLVTRDVTLEARKFVVILDGQRLTIEAGDGKTYNVTSEVVPSASPLIPHKR